jgi:hypothetical protein
MPVTAVQHVRRMRGGAQSHLMRADDGNFYVVKFKNNPQHLRVLTNEMIATRLADKIGLPVPQVEIVDVSEWLAHNSPELTIQLAGRVLKCEPGISFGSRYLVHPLDGEAIDVIPESMFGRVKNLETFAGMLALDKWTCNANGRQAVYWKKARDRKYTVSFVDQGYCFNAGEWSFPDAPLRGVYAWNRVYASVTGWSDFDPWLKNIETISDTAVWECAQDVPPEWDGCTPELERLMSTLLARRSRVRELIDDFRKSSRNPFPNWRVSVPFTTQRMSASVAVN